MIHEQESINKKIKNIIMFLQLSIKGVNNLYINIGFNGNKFIWFCDLEYEENGKDYMHKYKARDLDDLYSILKEEY